MQAPQPCDIVRVGERCLRSNGEAAWVVTLERRPATALGDTERFGIAVLRRRAFTALPAAFERRFIPLSSAQDKACSG